MVILQSQVQTLLSSGKLKEKSMTAPNHDFKHHLTRQLADLKIEPDAAHCIQCQNDLDS